MAVQKDRGQAQLLTSSTMIYPVINTSGGDIGSIHLTNVHATNSIRAFISIVPTGSTQVSGNSIVHNVSIGPSGLLNIAAPLFCRSGDAIMGSGDSAGLNAYLSFLRHN